jgi:hypothetical protein
VIEGSVQAIYQRLLVERFAQKAHGSSVHGALSEPLFWKSSDEDDGDALTLGDEPALQVKAGKTRQLQIGDQAGGLSEAPRFQEPLGGLKDHDFVP